jgi:histidine triad (HIT) family protein
MSSIFTKIISREIPAHIEYEDENVIVIHDIAPQAKHHLLVIPKQEIESTQALLEGDMDILKPLFLAIQTVTRQLAIQDGYKLHINSGKAGGQEVMHLHIHILSDI